MCGVYGGIGAGKGYEYKAFEEATKTFKKHKAGGLSGIGSDILLKVLEDANSREKLFEIYKVCFENNIVIEQWKNIRLSMLIAMGDVVSRLFSKSICKLLEPDLFNIIP